MPIAVDDTVKVAIITGASIALPSILATTIAAFVGWRQGVRSREASKLEHAKTQSAAKDAVEKVGGLETKINGRMDKIIEYAEAAAYAKGVADQIAKHAKETPECANYKPSSEAAKASGQ